MLYNIICWMYDICVCRILRRQNGQVIHWRIPAQGTRWNQTVFISEEEEKCPGGPREKTACTTQNVATWRAFITRVRDSHRSPSDLIDGIRRDYNCSFAPRCSAALAVVLLHLHQRYSQVRVCMCIHKHIQSSKSIWVPVACDIVTCI